MASREADQAGPESFNPFDPEHFRDPYPRLARLRASCPVVPVSHVGLFVASDECARSALRDYERLSNEGNFVLEGGATQDEPSNIVQLDPPQHSRMRRLLLAAFTPDAVTQLQPYIQSVAAGLVDGMKSSPRADIVSALAVPLPMAVLIRLVGVPEEGAALFKEWTTEITANLPDDFRKLPSWPAFKSYLQTQIDNRRGATNPPEDLLSRLLGATIDGERLTDAEIRMTVFQLIVAGFESTTHLISNCVFELLSTGQWARLHDDRDLVAAAVEESLRHDAPIEWVMRTVNTRHEMAGQPTHAGERVLIGLAAANRDPARWENPDEFDVDRERSEEHLAFGHGIHLCLGASLARAEAQIAITELVQAFPNLELEPGFTFERLPSAMLRGPARLDVRWT